MSANYTLKIINQIEHTVRFRLLRDDVHLSFREVFDLWESQTEFIQFYYTALNELQYEAFYWEHPALQEAFLDKRYECILQRSRPLEHLKANERAFEDHIHSDAEVVDFPNLGNNARLVVPTKKSTEAIYNHMSKFIRLAEPGQITSVFKRVGKVIKEELEQGKLIWLNTAGLGVIWLHIRMDTRPKYYKTVRYKKADFLGTIV